MPTEHARTTTRRLMQVTWKGIAVATRHPDYIGMRVRNSGLARLVVLSPISSVRVSRIW